MPAWHAVFAIRDFIVHGALVHVLCFRHVEKHRLVPAQSRATDQSDLTLPVTIDDEGEVRIGLQRPVVDGTRLPVDG